MATWSPIASKIRFFPGSLHCPGSGQAARLKITHDGIGLDLVWKCIGCEVAGLGEQMKCFAPDSIRVLSASHVCVCVRTCASVCVCLPVCANSSYFELFGKAAALNPDTCVLSLFPDVSTEIETGLCLQRLSQAARPGNHFQLLAEHAPSPALGSTQPP